MNRIPRIKPSFVVRSSYGDSAPFRTVESALDYIAGALKDRAVADGRYDETAVIIAATGETEESAPFADYVQPEDLRSPDVTAERERIATMLEDEARKHIAVEGELSTPPGRSRATRASSEWLAYSHRHVAEVLREFAGKLRGNDKDARDVLAAHPDTLNLADDIERHFKR